MKITYEKVNKQYKYLEDLGVGTIFRPKNSQTLYLVTDHTGGDEVFDEDMSTYYAKEDNIQNFDYDDVPPKGSRSCSSRRPFIWQLTFLSSYDISRTIKL